MFVIPAVIAAPSPVFDIDDVATPPVRVAPVPLPPLSLSDAAFEQQLSALFADPAKRPGLYVALYNLIERETPPPHAAVIVHQLMPYLSGSNAVEAIIPLKLLGMCGEAARPAAKTVLFLSTSPMNKMRLAAVEALGGMFYAPPGVSPSAPPAVTEVLIARMLSDADRGTKRAAAVALGRCRIATRPVVIALAATTGADDKPVALGALAGLKALGTDAKLALPALRNRLLDHDACANALPTLLAVASPQEAANVVAQTLTQTPADATFYAEPANVEYLQTLLYYAGQTPWNGINTAPLAIALLPRTQAVAMPAGETDLLAMRLSAAQAYARVSKNITETATVFAGIAASDGDPATRRAAVSKLGKLGKPALKSPAVLPALQTVLNTDNADLQGAAVAAVTSLGGSGTQSVVPRLSELLLAAWKAKRNARVVSLMNALYQMGAGASPAKPVLKTILAKEPETSANAELARAVLENIGTAGGAAMAR